MKKHYWPTYSFEGTLVGIRDEHGHTVQLSKLDECLNEMGLKLNDWLTQHPYTDPTAEEKRLAEYQAIPLDSVVEALIEAVAEGKTEKLDAIQAERLAIKDKYPITK